MKLGFFLATEANRSFLPLAAHSSRPKLEISENNDARCRYGAYDSLYETDQRQCNRWSGKPKAW